VLLDSILMMSASLSSSSSDFSITDSPDVTRFLSQSRFISSFEIFDLSLIHSPSITSDDSSLISLTCDFADSTSISESETLSQISEHLKNSGYSRSSISFISSFLFSSSDRHEMNQTVSCFDSGVIRSSESTFHTVDPWSGSHFDISDGLCVSLSFKVTDRILSSMTWRSCERAGLSESDEPSHSGDGDCC
jgi:hypothetical protein